MLGVWTVLRSGGVYDPEWVVRLEAGVRGNWDLTVPLQFFCLTDIDFVSQNITTVPIKHNWSGWWSKIELWRYDIHAAPGLYLDLDNVITGPISALFRTPFDAGFCAMNDPNRPGRVQSAVMRWSREWMLDYGRIIYEGMRTNPAKVMQDHPGGDQSYIESELDRWNLFDASIVASYKAHVIYEGLSSASVVQFHGEPKMHQLNQNDFFYRTWLGADANRIPR